MEVFIDGKHKERYLDPSIPAAYSAKGGDVLTFVTYDCFSNLITENGQKSSLLDLNLVNPATGPVCIDGAEPGDILKVGVLEIKLADTGLMAVDPSLGALKKVLKEERSDIFPIINGKIRFNNKIELDVKPMIGVIGTAPKSEAIDTDTPESHGGNLDCTRIAPGSVVYLPVNVPGANLSIGDVHALMGDGEVVLCGMECASTVKVRVEVLKGKQVPMPAVLDDEVFCTMVSAETLDSATEQVVYALHNFLMNQIGMADYEAAYLLSLVGNLRINQIVDPLVTVRMELPRKYVEDYLLSV